MGRACDSASSHSPPPSRPLQLRCSSALASELSRTRVPSLAERTGPLWPPGTNRWRAARFRDALPLRCPPLRGCPSTMSRIPYRFRRPNHGSGKRFKFTQTPSQRHSRRILRKCLRRGASAHFMEPQRAGRQETRPKRPRSWWSSRERLSTAEGHIPVRLKTPSTPPIVAQPKPPRYPGI